MKSGVRAKKKGAMVSPAELTVTVDERDKVTALLYSAAATRKRRVTMVLGHGAGANQLSGFMRDFATGLATRGFDVLTFNFIYMEQGRHVPDAKAKLESCYRSVIETALSHKKLKSNRLVIGGKSMGGRIASQVIASANENGDPLAEKISGLVLLGYPLHPPGNHQKLRAEHLKNIRAPMLFIQGTRDSLGTPDEISPIIRQFRLPATLYTVEGGDHSFKVPKSAAFTQTQVYEKVLDEVGRWMLAL